MFKKACSLSIKNYETHRAIRNKTRNKLAPSTPSNILICGYSGAGKTNLVSNLIYDYLYWDCLYVYAPNLQETKYQNLIEACKKTKLDNDFYTFENDLENAKTVDEMDSNCHNLIIFDDWISANSKLLAKISDYFIRGRKQNCTTIFLTQSYFQVPKVIRLNCSYFFIFATRDRREVIELYKCHSTMSKDEFIKIFYEATKDPFSFLLIDKTASASSPLAYRKNFNYLLRERL